MASQAHTEGVFALSLLNVPGEELQTWLEERYSHLTVDKYLDVICRIYQTIIKYFGIESTSPAQYSMRNLLALNKTAAVHEKLIGNDKLYRRAMDMLMAFCAEHTLKQGAVQDALWAEVVSPTPVGFLEWLLERFTKSTAERYVRVLSKVDKVLNTETSLFSARSLREVVHAICNMDIIEAGKHDLIYKKRVVRDMLDAFTTYAVMLASAPVKPLSLPPRAAVVPKSLAASPAVRPEMLSHERSFGQWLSDVLATPRVIRSYVQKVKEAGDFATKHFMCRHLFEVASVREGRHIMNMISRDPDGYELYFRRKVHSRIFRLYGEFLSRSRHIKGGEGRAVPPILSLESLGKLGDTPIKFSMAAFRSWAGSEVTGRVLQNYVDILQEGAAHALGRYGDLLHVRTAREAQIIISALHRDVEFATVHMSRAPQRRAYRLLMQYLTILSGKQDTRREDSISRLAPEWRSFAQWMAHRRYSSSHIKRRITALSKMAHLLQQKAGLSSIAECRDSSVICKMREMVKDGTLGERRHSNILALEKYFHYVQDEYGGDFEKRPELMLGDYGYTARAFRDWLISVGIKEGSERNYITGLRDLGACLGDEKAFFTAQSMEEVVHLKERCEGTALYAQWNNGGIKDFPKQVYNWFMDFLSSHTLVSASDAAVQHHARETKLRDVLMKQFGGVLPGLNDELYQSIVRRWAEEYDELCPLSEDDMRRLIAGITVEDASDGCRYFPESVIPEAALGYITAFVEDAFASGLRYVHYESLMSRAAAAFPESAQHWNSARLGLFRDCLRFRLPMIFSFGSKALKHTAPDKNAPARALSDMICSFLREQQRPLTLEEIQTRFPQISPKIISRICSNREGAAADVMMCLNKGVFCHVDIVKIDPREWQSFVAELEGMVARREVSQGELFASARHMFPGWFTRNELIAAPVMFFKYVRRRMHGKFTFTRSFIYRLGAEKQTIVQNFEDACAALGNTFTTKDLREILDQYHAGMNPPWESIYKRSVRVSGEQFVDKADVRFDVDAVDDALEKACTEDVMPILLIRSFSSFPPGPYPWSLYLLEQFVYRYSKRFRLLHTRFGTDVKGFIVRRSSGIDSFEEAFARHLAVAPVQLDESSVLLYAALRGIVASRRYGKLAQVLAHARKLRGSADA